MNCFKYKTKEVCEECFNKFFLIDNKCKAVTIMEGCELYDGTANETICK